MDHLDYDLLADYLKAVPDPRDPRGVRHPWWVVLTIIAAGLMAGHRNCRQLARWARLHRRTLAPYLPLHNGLPPSESTLQRGFAAVDIVAFEALVSRFIAGQQPAAEPSLVGLALDGKAVRGASRHGTRCHLLSVASHRTGAVLRQRNVSVKENEVPVARRLLADWDLQGCVVTADALHCQRRLAQQICAQGGDYLLQVKDNQPELHANLQFLFASPRAGRHPLEFRASATLDGGHGRIEARGLEASVALNEYLDWPQVGQVVHRVCRRSVAGRDSTEHHYWITSLRPEQAGPAELERLCRGHWGIENQVHYTRDVTFGEDACQTRRGDGPQVRAALVNAITALFRAKGVRYLTDAITLCQAEPATALQWLGLSATLN